MEQFSITALNQQTGKNQTFEADKDGVIHIPPGIFAMDNVFIPKDIKIVGVKCDPSITFERCTFGA